MAAARGAVVAAVVALAILGSASVSRAAIVTYGGGPLRTDLYMSMHRLTPRNVRSAAFGRLFDRVLPDRGQVYSQPLLADGRLIVATEKNDVYELDPRTGRILRSRFLVPPWQPILQTAGGPITCKDLYPTVGVTSTPVIDTSADNGGGVIYLTADTPAPAGSAPHINPAEYLMYALRLNDLSNDPSFNGGQPLQLTATSGGYTFDAAFQLQRAALLEMGGKIFAAFGSHCDTSPYFGWVMGVRASDGALVGSWASQSAPGARGGGIWQAGGGLMSDGPGRLYVATGNGFDAPGSNAEHTPASPTPGNNPPPGLASSAIRLQVGSDGSLSTADFFTPCTAFRLDGQFQNLDFGSSGVVGLPSIFSGHSGPPLLVVSSKVGTIYLLDRNSLGGFSQGRKTAACPGGGDAVPGELSAFGSVWGEFAVWPFGGGWLYVPTDSPGPAPDESHGSLHVYHGSLGSMKLVGATGDIWGKGSGSPIITSVGSRTSTALVWDVSKGVGAPSLHVYLPEVPRRAHAPTQVAQFPVGPFTKFAPPGVGDDAIFVPGDGHIVAFGIKRRH